MSTQNYIVDTTKYIKVAESDCVIQNLSPYPIRVIFSDTYPAQDSPDYRLVEPRNTKKGTTEHIISRYLNIPSGDVYVRGGGSEVFNRESEISVTLGGTNTSESLSTDQILQLIYSELKHLRFITQETFDKSDITKQDIEDC